jgi:hypothetical protein
VRHVSLVQLYEDNREKLLLNWASSHQADRRIEIKGSNNYGADLVGHINIIHPERLQVMGLAEYEWAMRMAERRFGQMFTDLLAAHYRCRRLAAAAATGRYLQSVGNAADLFAQAMLGGDRSAAHLSVVPSGQYRQPAWRLHGRARHGGAGYR